MALGDAKGQGRTEEGEEDSCCGEVELRRAQTFDAGECCDYIHQPPLKGPL